MEKQVFVPASGARLKHANIGFVNWSTVYQDFSFAAAVT